MALHNIDGYREGTSQEFWLVLKDSRWSITVPSGLENRAGLIEWFKERYQDVDRRECGRRLKALLKDESLAFTKKERKLRLDQANKQVGIGFLAGVLLLLWIIFFPRPMSIPLASLSRADAWGYRGTGCRNESAKESVY